MNSFKNARLLFASALFSVLLLPALARADSVTSKSLGDLPASLDLNTFDAWAYYADVTAPEFDNGAPNPSPTTDAANLASFSAVATVPSGSFFASDTQSTNMSVTYVGGTGGSNGPAQTDSTDYDFAVGGLTLSTKLIATTETLNFYLYAYQGATDLSLTTGDQTFTLYTDKVLPEVESDSNSAGSGDTEGELSVTVQGTIGDTLTFTALPDNTNVDGPGHIGLQAVTVEVPEPSTYVMLLGGLGLLFCLRRRAWSKA